MTARRYRPRKPNFTGANAAPLGPAAAAAVAAVAPDAAGGRGGSRFGGGRRSSGINRPGATKHQQSKFGQK